MDPEKKPLSAADVLNLLAHPSTRTPKQVKRVLHLCVGMQFIVSYPFVLLETHYLTNGDALIEMFIEEDKWQEFRTRLRRDEGLDNG